MRPDDTNLWKASKRLLYQVINTILPLTTDNHLMISDAEKCNVFSELLCNTFSDNQIININKDRRFVELLELGT